MKNQKDWVLNVPKEFGNKHLFLTKKICYFLRYFIIGERTFLGSMSFQFLLPMETVLGKELKSSLLCIFAFAFDRHANSSAFSFNAFSPSSSSGISASSLIKYITNLFDPWESLTQEWFLFVQRPNLWYQLHMYRANNWLQLLTRAQCLVFPWIQPFGCDAACSLGRVYSRQATVLNCVRSPMSFVMKDCPFSTTLRNPASTQNLLVVTAFQFVLHIVAIEDLESLGHQDPTELLSWSDWARMKNLIVPSQRVSPFSQERIFLFTYVCDWSITDWTALQKRSCESLNCFLNGSKVNRQFSTSFASELTSGQWSRSTENRTSAIGEFHQHLLRDIVQDSLRTVLFHKRPLFLSTKTNEWPLSFSKSSCIQRYESSVCQTFFFIVFCYTRNAVEHRHE